MNKLFASLLFTYACINAPLYSFTWNELSLTQKVVLGTAGTAATIASAIGFYKFCNWAYYYSTDHTSVEVFKVRLSYQLKYLQPFFEDYNIYISKQLTIPLLMYQRYPNQTYPTLTYYDNLATIDTNLYYLHEAFERKKTKTQIISEIEDLESIIQEISHLRNQISHFKTIIKSSTIYSTEYKAKYPPMPVTTTIVVCKDSPHHEHTYTHYPFTNY